MSIEIICDIGINHNGNMRIATNLIDVAKRYGASVAKFQLYDVDKLFNKDWDWYNVVKPTQLTFTQAKNLAKHCDSIGIEFMASVFDTERVAWCEEIGVKRYKIASRSIHDKELISAIEATGKPIIVSLGLWNEEEWPKIKGNVSFLYCVSKYPAALTDISWDELTFGDQDDGYYYDGFSDHTAGIDASICAVARGARIIEKHLTFNKRALGPDHACSMEPRDLKHLMQHIRAIEILRGTKE